MGIVRELTARRMTKASRHPEVDQENASAVEPNNYIFAATIDRCDPLAYELGSHCARRERPGQAFVDDFDALDPPSLEERRKLRPDGLDLGQLGHRPSVTRASPAMALSCYSMTSSRIVCAGSASSPSL